MFARALIKSVAPAGKIYQFLCKFVVLFWLSSEDSFLFSLLFISHSFPQSCPGHHRGETFFSRPWCSPRPCCVSWWCCDSWAGRHSWVDPWLTTKCPPVWWASCKFQHNDRNSAFKIIFYTTWLLYSVFVFRILTCYNLCWLTNDLLLFSFQIVVEIEHLKALKVEHH